MVYASGPPVKEGPAGRSGRLAIRFIIFGAGGIGGVVGGRLFQSGHEVVLIARGAHQKALAEQGLTLETPAEKTTLPISVVSRGDEIEWRHGDLVLLAVKSQDTTAAVAALIRVAPAETDVVCLQNGVENERACLRHFRSVYGCCVMCPAGHLKPGLVQAYSSPTTGLMDFGLWPNGVDDVTEELAQVFNGATFDSRSVDDISRWKYRKLINNLGNAVEALFGEGTAADRIGKRARDEGEGVLRAAGIAFTTRQEDLERRGQLLKVQDIGAHERPGSSTRQSLIRQVGSVEVDYLNGEIALLGRLHGVATPVNEALQRQANKLAVDGREPGSAPIDDLIRELD